ncbi:DegQ family serine endoprotease [Rubrimonas cliftonensis]|uniref:Probable periplasmic serine endoprotease DegP-like n=1 Tax=Rubrimonas cliftonensis TaxID=89524 RepID=A0A1H3VWD4_9RHOB|nr:DegQ family serine endoprotease [Rubrimonas cliftonensis]SDZ78402.1 serine protease Do [Rubrimonas cliftonensis]
MTEFSRLFSLALRAGAVGLTMGLAAPAFAPDEAAAQERPPSFADLAEQLSPAVVNISTRQSVGAAGPQPPNIPEGAPFEDLFRDFFERNQRGPRSVSSLGSGFVIDPSGVIVTNNHVIENADEIVANFSDGSSLPATLLGTDPKTDIAVLKVEPTSPLISVDLGDSDAIRVGDWVLAIGNPFGLGGSVSAGIVSARNRDINAGPYDDFIQTDAAINRGNSGGPLFNLEGQVIGVNTAIISPSGGSIGIGFSVPSNLVNNIVAQLREYGQTRRGWLGVRIQTVTPEIAEGLDLDPARGALIADVTRGGPAAEAGMEPGDVIVTFDGQDVDEMRDLPRIVADTAVGADVPVGVWRKGSLQTLRVEVGLLEENEVATLPDGANGAPSAELGMTLEALTAETRANLGLDEDVEGVVVSAVESDSPAAEKGVRPGDVIVEVAQTPVSQPREVVAKIDEARKARRSTVLLLLQTAGELRFVALSLEN